MPSESLQFLKSTKEYFKRLYILGQCMAQRGGLGWLYIIDMRALFKEFPLFIFGLLVILMDSLGLENI